MEYIKKSKTTEAKNNLRGIGDGAVSYFEAEHTSADGMIITTRQYPPTGKAGALGISPTANTIGVKATPLNYESEFDTAPWSDLNFRINAPFYYYYMYGAESSISSTTTAGNSNLSFFQALASASLADNQDSIFCIEGYDNGTLSPLLDASAGMGNNSASTRCKATTVTVPSARPTA